MHTVLKNRNRFNKMFTVSRTRFDSKKNTAEFGGSIQNGTKKVPFIHRTYSDCYNYNDNTALGVTDAPKDSRQISITFYKP
jgi:hypothetical protein